MNSKIKRLSIGLIAAIVVYTIVLLFAFLNPSLFDQIAREDSIIEWVGALGFLFAALFFVLYAIRSNDLKSAKSKWAYLIILTWALVSFVSFGEEISWGQRIFGFQLDEKYQVENWREAEGAFQNLQNETNLHNMGFVETSMGNSRVALMLQIVPGLLLPLLALSRKIKSFFNRIYLPIIPVQFIPFMIGSYVITKVFSFNPQLIENAFQYRRFNEFTELTIGISYLIFALYCYLKPDSVFKDESI